MSKRALFSKEKILCPKKDVEETTLKLLGTVLGEHDRRRCNVGSRIPFGRNRCGRSLLSNRQGKALQRRREPAVPNQEEIRMFTHFSKETNCEVCRMTEKTCARCKPQTFRKRRGDLTRHFIRRPYRSRPQNLKLWKRVKKRPEECFHCARLRFVFDSKVHLRKMFAAAEAASCLQSSMPPSKQLGVKKHRQFEGVHQTMSRSSMMERHEYSSPLRKTVVWKKELFDEDMKEQQQRWLNVAFPRNSGIAQNMFDNVPDGKTAYVRRCVRVFYSSKPFTI